MIKVYQYKHEKMDKKSKIISKIKENNEFLDNSFICDYTEKELSLFISDSEIKTPNKKKK